MKDPTGWWSEVNWAPYPVGEFKYLRVLFTSEGRREIVTASAVMGTNYWAFVVNDK